MIVVPPTTRPFAALASLLRSLPSRGYPLKPDQASPRPQYDDSALSPPLPRPVV